MPRPAAMPERDARLLAEARRHVLEGAPRVARQRALVEHLHESGADATLAEALLLEMNQTMRCFVDHLERLMAEADRPH
jgi:hypothetical protein